MPTDEEALKVRQSLRFRVLKTMFDKTIGVGKNPNNQAFTPEGLAQNIEQEIRNVKLELQYLEGEGLIRLSMRVFDSDYNLYNLTHQGIVEIERVIEYPNQRTEHFMLSVVQHFHANVGSVQNGPNAVSNVKGFGE